MSRATRKIKESGRKGAHPNSVHSQGVRSRGYTQGLFDASSTPLNVRKLWRFETSIRHFSIVHPPRGVLGLSTQAVHVL